MWLYRNIFCYLQKLVVQGRKEKKKQESNTANCHTIFDKSFIATEFQAKNESEMQFYTQMELDQHIGSAWNG